VTFSIYKELAILPTSPCHYLIALIKKTGVLQALYQRLGSILEKIRIAMLINSKSIFLQPY
jgi:hypothetical protein